MKTSPKRTCDEVAAKRKQDDAEVGRGGRRMNTEGAPSNRDSRGTAQNTTTKKPERETQTQHDAHTAPRACRALRAKRTHEYQRAPGTQRTTREPNLPGDVSPNRRFFREADFGSFFDRTFRTWVQKRNVPRGNAHA